jgi:hypothetical protein
MVLNVPFDRIENDASSLVLDVFQAYLVLVRKLQSTYTLEPAGSHGTMLLYNIRCMGSR